jgi:plastocyanin
VENAAGIVVSATALLAVITNVPVSFTASQMTTNGFRMWLAGTVASDYIILASTDFTNWTPISTNPAPGGTVDFTDTSARNHSVRFYRAMVR